ncbi:MAG: hypothetical protein EX260_05855 [Desulfobulbaceae bacterium]|nr:MAG: hypothetical protein EX260_05855 [Desulfobulbaceae bacterium]
MCSRSRCSSCRPVLQSPRTATAPSSIRSE